MESGGHLPFWWLLMFTKAPLHTRHCVVCSLANLISSSHQPCKEGVLLASSVISNNSSKVTACNSQSQTATQVCPLFEAILLATFPGSETIASSSLGRVSSTWSSIGWCPASLQARSPHPWLAPAIFTLFQQYSQDGSWLQDIASCSRGHSQPSEADFRSEN